MMFSILLILSSIGQISTDGLTPAQKAELQLQAAKLAEENGQDKSAQSQIKKAKEWAELGTQVGVALVATAKELGIAVEDFSHTSVGKITIGMICWKLVGKEIVRSFIGIGLLVIGIPLWCKYFNKLCLVQQIEYKDGKMSKISYKDVRDLEGIRFAMVFILLALVAVGVLIVLV
jgi:hypothetical protein